MQDLSAVSANVDIQFADRIITRCRARGHCLCVGLDPHLQLVPELFRQGDMSPSDPRTSQAVESFLTAIVEQVAEHAVALKPQIAFFEQLGCEGIAALERIVKAARPACCVVMDAKRGDIGSTATAYANAFLVPGAALESDALTINPYLGTDSLEPFIRKAETHHKGLFVLVKTSNPGSAEFQDQSVAGLPLYVHIAGALQPAADRLRGAETGWSGLGVVVGATKPADALAVRAAMPRGLFLVPGFGAQGGTAAAAVRGFSPGPAGLEGGIVNASRSILFPDAAAVGDSKRWAAAIQDNLQRSIEALRAATRSTPA